jgi:hypothetical protein
VSGLTEFEKAGIARMVAADREAAPHVMVDAVLAALLGAAEAGVRPVMMVAMLENISSQLIDRLVERGDQPSAPITAPRKAV